MATTLRRAPLSVTKLALVGFMLGLLTGIFVLRTNTANGYNSYSPDYIYLKDDWNNKAIRRTEVTWDNWVCSGTCSMPLYTVTDYTNIISSTYSFRYELIESQDYWGRDPQYYGTVLTYWNSPSASPVWSPYRYLDDVFHNGVTVVSSSCYYQDCQLFSGGGGSTDEVRWPYNSNNPYRSWYRATTTYP